MVDLDSGLVVRADDETPSQDSDGERGQLGWWWRDEGHSHWWLDGWGGCHEVESRDVVRRVRFDAEVEDHLSGMVLVSGDTFCEQFVETLNAGEVILDETKEKRGVGDVRLSG